MGFLILQLAGLAFIGIGSAIAGKFEPVTFYGFWCLITIGHYILQAIERRGDA